MLLDDGDEFLALAALQLEDQIAVPLGVGAGTVVENHTRTTVMCNAGFLADGYVRLGGRVFQKSKKPRPQPFAAAGFVFAYAVLLEEVPFDPHLDYLFDGEEILYSARMWTHGYNIYSPSVSVLFHYYYRAKAKKFWSVGGPQRHVRLAAATKRVNLLMETVHKDTDRRIVASDYNETAVVVDLAKYGMGSERPLSGWYDYAGVDKSKHTVRNKFC